MRPQLILLVTCLASLCLHVAGRATDKDCTEICSPDSSGGGYLDAIRHEHHKRGGRFRIGRVRGHGEASSGEPAAAPQAPRLPAQHIVNHPAPLHYSTPEPYARWVNGLNGKPAGTVANRKTYLQAGRAVIAKMNAPRVATNDAVISGPLIEFNKAATNKVNNAAVKLEPKLVYESAASTVGMDLNKLWRHDEWVTKDMNMDISSTYFDTESRTLVSAVADNRELKSEMTWSGEDNEGKALFTEQQAVDGLPFHSTIWTHTYSEEMKGTGVKFIIRSQIINDDTKDMIQIARAQLRPNARDTQVVTMEVNSANEAEKQAFEALAGSDNGRTVFRMMADYRDLMRNAKVVKCHTWGPKRGQSGEHPMIVWETDLPALPKL
ncbi:hypothetical protein FKW77_003649 [Venturia effusa]|uniref:Uncharacterized protein n=1 Tax=Venturia effusa TaxID=50376 RepID=A0A517L315_9PEZI|nr:hypothetical protein FKW77_003649 [Venturia effusa]